MPNTLFLFGSLISGLIAWTTSKESTKEEFDEKTETTTDEENIGKIEIDEVSDNSSISLDLGYGLISLVDSNDKKTAGPLISKITSIRKQVSKDLGFIIPNVRVKDDLSLDANSYKIRIGHTIVAEDKVYVDRKLAMPGDETQLKVQGIQVQRSIFRIRCILD